MRCNNHQTRGLYKLNNSKRIAAFMGTCVMVMPSWMRCCWCFNLQGSNKQFADKIDPTFNIKMFHENLLKLCKYVCFWSFVAFRSYRYDRRSAAGVDGVKHKPTNLFGSTLAVGGRPATSSLGRPRSLDRASALSRPSRPLSAATARPFSVAAAQQFGTAALR